MFSDYNGYFKGGRTGASRADTVGESCTGSMPLRDKGAAAGGKRAEPVRREQTGGHAKKTTLRAAAQAARLRFRA